MPTHNTIIIPPTTGTAQSTEFEVDRRVITVFGYGSLVADAQYGDLQRKDPTGAWQDVYDSNGQVRLHGGRPGVNVESGGVYRINKLASVGNIGFAVVDSPQGV